MTQHLSRGWGDDVVGASVSVVDCHKLAEHRIEGVTVRVYATAKTVADCFKYRNKIGLDVALEALRDYRRVRGSLDDLWRFARTCRVDNVMRPYLEATA